MITATDLFCGAGGSGLGAKANLGVELVMAANHSARAIETHALNFPGCKHDCADISQVEPRRYRRTNILWASPECTNHSVAKGRKRKLQPDMFGDVLPDHVAERSRATMWDVPRFVEVHRYDAVIVENVVDAAHWEPFPAWLMAMDNLGYHHRAVFLNSMHAPAVNAPRAPQSRDRMYVRYRAQYVYRCPTARCHPLSDKTMARIRAGLDRYARGPFITVHRGGPNEIRTAPIDGALPTLCAGGTHHGLAWPPLLVPSGGTWNEEAQPVGMPFRARTCTENEGLLVPVEGRDGLRAAPTGQPIRTQTARHETALVVPLLRHRSRPTGEPLPTMCTVETAGLESLVGWPSELPDAEDCSFRMLLVPEIQAAMAFTPDYVITGNKREQVAQLGNAVTPPAAEWLIRAVVESLSAEGGAAA